MSACRSCGRPINWAVTTKGRTIPVDVEPQLDGNVIYTGHIVATHPGHEAPEVRVEAVEPLFDDGTPRYVAHFVTCPQADQWRKP